MRAWAVMLLAALAPAWGEVAIAYEWDGARGEDLLVNGSFEELDGELPSGWRWSTARPDNFDLSADPGALDGERCVKIVTHSSVMSGYLSQAVAVEPETDYLLSVWLRAESGVYLTYVRAQRDDGVKLDPPFDRRVYARCGADHVLSPVFLKPEWLPGQPAMRWTPLLLRLRSTPAMTRLTVNIGSYFRPGVGWYDKAVLTKRTGELVCRVTADEDLASIEVYDAAFTPRGPAVASGIKPLAKLAPAPPGTREWSAPIRTATGAIRIRTRVVTAGGKEYWARYPTGEEDL